MILQHQNKKFIFAILSVLSLVIWISTVGSVSIDRYPADALHYAKSLTPLYWIGVTITLGSLAASYSLRNKDYTRLAAILLLTLYLHGLPSFIYENPRHIDEYLHSSGALAVFNAGRLDTGPPLTPYAEEYPTAFILLTDLMLVENIPTFLLLKFHSLLVMMLLVTLTYFLARRFIPTYASVASLGVASVLWVSIHFSPQGLALVFFVIFLLSLSKVLYYKENRQKARSWTIITLICAASIIMTNPTSTYFTFAGLACLAAAAYILPFKFGVGSRYSLTTIFMVFLVFWMGWATFSADTLGVDRTSDKVFQALNSFGSVSQTSIPLAPSPSFLIVNMVEYLVTGFVIMSGLVMLWYLHKKKGVQRPLLLFLAVWFIAPLLLAPVSAFYFFGSGFLQRFFLFAVFPWAVILSLFMQLGRPRINLLLGLIVVASALLMPITKYGPDPFIYLSSSDLMSTDIITQHAQNNKMLVFTSEGQSLKYYVLQNNATSAAVGTMKREPLPLNNGPSDQPLYPPRFNTIVIPEHIINNIELRRGIDFPTDQYENNRSHNLIVDTGGSQIYYLMPHARQPR